MLKALTNRAALLESITNSYFSLCVSCRLQPAVPLKLKNKEEVDMFFDGRLPKLAKEATDIAVLGMFGDEKRKGKVWFRRNGMKCWFIACLKVPRGS